MADAVRADEGCGCGCGTVTVGSTTQTCGCGCSSDAPKDKDQAIAELTALRESIDRRLSELAS